MMVNLSRLLYVEDDADSVELVRLMLGGETDFYEIISTDSATEALALHHAEKFDLYILDYRLPDMSGIELCRRIRQMDKTTPILFFTAMARPADQNVAIAAGASEYLVKPDDLDRLPGMVKSLLDLNNLCESLASRRACREIRCGKFNRFMEIRFYFTISKCVFRSFAEFTKPAIL